MRVLLITSRNVYGTSGELRLIKNRTETLFHSFGVETDILLFKRDRVLKNKQEIFDYKSLEGVFYNWKNHVFKFRDFLSRIKEKLNKEHYDAVIISGGFILFNMEKYIKKTYPRLRVVDDVHGTIEELVEFPGRTFVQTIVRRLYYFISSKVNNNSSYIDGFFVVSNALRKEMTNKQNGLIEKCFFIVPCGIRETEINSEENFKNRKIYRNKYGIKDDEILFVYSGGVSPWQCIEESVAMFMNYSKVSSRKCKMLILSGNKEYVSKFKSDNIIVDSYAGDEVRKVLCAGDYAFLLRGDYKTNHVAYPNKFLEYVSSGMRIIATNNVDDIAAQIREYSVGIIVGLNDSLCEKINDVPFEYLSDKEGRDALLLATSFKTTLLPFVNFLKS